MIADSFDCFLLDLDGTTYRGDSRIAGVAETIQALRTGGKAVVFMTNNSAATPARLVDKLAGLGIEASADEVVTSALATAELLAGRGGGRVFVIGEEGLREALASVGIEVVEGEPAEVDSVVVGWDRGADYAKLRTASLLVERGAALVATNADAAYPAPDGLWPGAGALLAAVTTTTGASAEVVGKPGSLLCELALRAAGGSRPLVVGDRLDTDIAAARRLWWPSLLVLTGIASVRDLPIATDLPTFVGSDMSALLLEANGSTTIAEVMELASEGSGGSRRAFVARLVDGMPTA